MMVDVDRELRAAKTPIPHRPLKAMQIIAQKYSISFPATRPPLVHARISENDDIGDRINQWFQTQYGDQLKMDWSAGRGLVLFDEDFWQITFPRIYGNVRFVSSPNFGRNKEFGFGRATCNITQLLAKITSARAQSAGHGEFENLYLQFVEGLEASYSLENHQSNNLIRIARSNIATSVQTFTMQEPAYGESKWASLQAAEKILKFCILQAGKKYPNTHDLRRLYEILFQAGMRFESEDLIHAVQCTPAIRYGDEPCTSDDAFNAHQAVWRLVNRIVRAKAGLTSAISLGSA